MRAQISDELKKRAILLDKVQSGSNGQHHHYEINGTKYEQYLGTNNKRPGPAMEESQAERDMMVLRKDKNKREEAKNFKFSSPRVNLKVNDWKKMISIEQASQSGVFYIGQPFGAFVLKGSSEVVSSYFATKFFQKLLIPVPEMRIVPFNE